jgi:hypothetical protein
MDYVEKKEITIKNAVDLLNMYNILLNKKHNKELEDSDYQSINKLMIDKKIKNLRSKITKLNIDILEDEPNITIDDNEPDDISLRIDSDNELNEDIEYTKSYDFDKETIQESGSVVLSQTLDTVAYRSIINTINEIEIYTKQGKIIPTNNDDVVFKFNVDNQYLINKEGEAINVSDINDFSMNNLYTINLYDLPKEIRILYKQLKEINKEKQEKIEFKVKKRINNLIPNMFKEERFK